MPPPGTITLRNALGTAAAVAAVGALPKTASALDLTNPANKLEVYTRMRGGTADGELVLWWWNGNVWGKMNEDVAVVLMQIEGLTFQGLTRNADGTYLQISAGRGTFRHADTGAPLQSWTNPINGRCRRARTTSSPSTAAPSPPTAYNANPASAFWSNEAGITTPVVNGGQIFCRKTSSPKSKAANRERWARRRPLTVFTADAAAIADDTASFRPCTHELPEPRRFSARGWGWTTPRA